MDPTCLGRPDIPALRVRMAVAAAVVAAATAVAAAVVEAATGIEAATGAYEAAPGGESPFAALGLVGGLVQVQLDHVLWVVDLVRSAWLRLVPLPTFGQRQVLRAVVVHGQDCVLPIGEIAAVAVLPSCARNPLVDHHDRISVLLGLHEKGGRYAGIQPGWMLESPLKT